MMVFPATHPLDLTGAGFTARDLATPIGRMRVFTSEPISGRAARTLVLLHGIGGGASSFYWTWLAPILVRHGYRVIAPDLVGWGASDHPGRFVLFDDYVVQIRTLLGDVGPVEAVVAQSLTSGFAIAARQAQPHSVRRLVMLAPTGGRDFGRDAFDPVPRAVFGTLANLPVVNMLLYKGYFHRRQAQTTWFERRGFMDKANIPGSLVEAGFRSATRPNAAYSALPFVAGALRYDLAPLIAQVDVPALTLWGDGETQIKADIRDRLAAVNPTWVRTRAIAGARTNFEIERPEETAAAIIAFLDDVA